MREEEEGILKHIWDNYRRENGGEEDYQEGEEGIEKGNSEED